MFGRRKVATLVAEFLGTGILVLLFLSVSRSQLALAFFIAATAGLTYAFITAVFGKVSGGYFNPALTIGDWTLRRISTVTALLYVGVQLLGGWLSYYLFTYFIGQNLPSGKHSFNGRVLAAEAIGTAIFAIGWATARSYQRVIDRGQAPLAGLSYMVGMLAASSVVGVAILNPAIALGSHVWVWGSYAAGPVLGAVVGVNLHRWLFDENLLAASDRAAAQVKSKTSVAARKTAVKRPAAKKKTTRKK